MPTKKELKNRDLFKYGIFKSTPINIQLKKAVGTKKAKYGNKKTLYNGILYDSIKEAHYASTLDLLLKKGVVTDIKRQVIFRYDIKMSNGERFILKKGKYIADFVVTYSDNRVEVVDVKGFKTAKYKRDCKIMKKLFNIDIVEK